MKTYCTRPGCPRPINVFADLDDRNTLKTVQQKFCTACGMPQLLIGRYIPIRLLGRGGFGTAFLAVDRYTPTMRKCVVKQFLPSGDLSPDQLQIAQELFEREAEALEKLGNPHPQIPDLFAFFELNAPPSQPGHPSQLFYLVQEYINGQNMQEELEQKGAFSETETRLILDEVLKILKFVHDNGSIHRDIKPSNIMRDRQGCIHLLDFGAVKQVANVQGAASQSSTGIYSMGYAPPEQMSGGIVYPATDLYALAVTCVSLLTNKPPMELYDSYSNTWNWRAYVQVDDLFEGVLNRMLLSTPSERFQSAQEVIDALKQPSRPRRSASAMPSSRAAVPPPPPPLATGAKSPSPVQPSAPVGASASPQHQLAPPPKAQPLSSLSSLRPFPILSGAAFFGFEVGLVAIATLSVLGLSVVSFGILAIAALALLMLQLRQVIENIDLVILAGLSLGLALIAQFVFGFVDALILLIVLPMMAGLLCLAGAILFFLIYRILMRIF